MVWPSLGSFMHLFWKVFSDVKAFLETEILDPLYLARLAIYLFDWHLAL